MFVFFICVLTYPLTFLFSNTTPLIYLPVLLRPSLSQTMALSYLIGSQGHFGQPNFRSSASTVQANRNDSSLIMSDSDVELFVELLANTMNHRGKNGPGGKYLSGTFSSKCVLFSLRCLLTHTSNQDRIAKLVGPDLNSLLINALAIYALEPSTSPMDSESAGHVVFSLYLLSNYCFEELSFLPAMYAPLPAKTAIEDEDHGLAANILVSYLRLSDIPPTGRHAARQLLLRLKFMNFERNYAVVSRCRFCHKCIGSSLCISFLLLFFLYPALNHPE